MTKILRLNANLDEMSEWSSPTAIFNFSYQDVTIECYYGIITLPRMFTRTIPLIIYETSLHLISF